MNEWLFDSDPRTYATDLVGGGVVDAETMLTACLKYMSCDDVREMLDMNELSPRFDEPDEEDETPNEPEDGDFVLCDSGPLGSRTTVNVVGGKSLGEFGSFDEAMRAVHAQMKTDAFFPNIWVQDDHGGITLQD